LTSLSLSVNFLTVNETCRSSEHILAKQSDLSRRERQIMDVVWQRKEATATDVVGMIDNPPSRTSVRTLMRILEEKGHLAHRVEGREFVYRATKARQRVGQRALTRVVKTFFGGSLRDAMAAHLADPSADLSEEELARLDQLIRDARKGKSS
jgi:BlaI family penicillinase repressor